MLFKLKEEINKNITESPRFPIPGTYIYFAGDNNAFKWTTTIKEDGTFTSVVNHKNKSATGDGVWKVESGRVFIRWKNIPDFLEKIPGEPDWIDETETFKSISPVKSR